MPRQRWLLALALLTALPASLLWQNAAAGQTLTSAGVLAPARAADWQDDAGIPNYSQNGSLPSNSWTQCGSTIAAYGSSGSYGSPSTIISALTACSGKSAYVLLGPGDFYLNGGVSVTGLSNVELRGSGPDQTRLHFNNSASCQGGNGTCLVGFQSSDSTCPNCGTPSTYSWTAGYAQGSNTVTLSSSSNIVAGTMLVLDQCDTGYSGSTCAGSAVDNGNAFNCGDAYNPNGPNGCSYNAPLSGSAIAHRFQEEMVTVVSCSPSCNNAGTTVVTIAEPLIHANWASGQTPQAWYIQPAKYVGIRSLNIDASATTYNGTTTAVSFSNDEYFWMQDTAINSPPNIGVWVIQSMHGDIESNYMYNSGQSNVSTDNSGFNWYGSDNLIANNICQNCHLASITNGPAAGNVLAYNFFVNSFTGNGTIFGTIWDGHGNGDDYNLIEGNAATQIFSDQAHGTHLMETFYRNFLPGWESCANGNCGSDALKTGDVFGAGDLSFNRYNNYVGNVLGTPGVHTLGYTFTNAEYFTSNPDGNGYPWNVGSGNQVSPSAGYAGGPIPVDPVVSTTLLRWGNWDAFNNATQWNTGEVPSGISAYSNQVPTACTSSVSCPASFYYNARPAWWSPSIPFPAIGPDVTNGDIGQVAGALNRSGHQSGTAALIGATYDGDSVGAAWAGHINATPAMACYFSLGGLPDGTGNQLTFTPASCYGSGSGGTAPPLPPPPPPPAASPNPPTALTGVIH